MEIGKSIVPIAPQRQFKFSGLALRHSSKIGSIVLMPFYFAYCYSQFLTANNISRLIFNTDAYCLLWSRPLRAICARTRFLDHKNSFLSILFQPFTTTISICIPNIAARTLCHHQFEGRPTILRFK